jgi:hypothetical protein
MVPLATDIKAACLPFVGTLEIHQNLGFHGPLAGRLTYLLRDAGWTPGQPYCAFTATALIGLAYRLAKVPLPPQLAINGSTSGIAHTAQAHGKLSSVPATGALALEKGGPTGWHHTEVVLAVHGDGTMITFGANTEDPDTGAEGIWLHTRNVADFDFVLS